TLAPRILLTASVRQAALGLLTIFSSTTPAAIVAMKSSEDEAASPAADACAVNTTVQRRLSSSEKTSERIKCFAVSGGASRGTSELSESMTRRRALTRLI